MSGCLLRGFLKRKNINSIEGLSPDSKELLLDMDALTVSLATTIPTTFIESNEDPYTDADIITSEIDLAWKKTGPGVHDWKRVPVKDITHIVSPSFTTTVLKEDDLFGKYTVLEQLTGGALRSKCLFPLQDEIVFTNNDTKLLQELKLGEGAALPTSYNTDFNMQSDESFSRIFFYGLGATLLVAQNGPSDDAALGPFVIDLPLEKLKMRPGFHKYGCKIYFSKDQMVTAISYDGKKVLRGGEGWDVAKWIAKSTTFFLVTAREHLIWTHLILSNVGTLASTLKLRPSHPIRRLITVFTFRTTEVNTNAFDSLVPKMSLLHRACGLDYDGMKKAFEYAYTTSNIFEPFSDRQVIPELQELADQGKFPFVSEGVEYFDIIRQFVRSWLQEAGEAAYDKEAQAFYNAVKSTTEGQKYVLPKMEEKDAMANLLSQIIFTVTAYHELVGNIVDYAIRPDRAGWRMVPGKSQADVQSYLLTALITAATSLRMPSLMSPFSKFFGVDGPAWERTLWDDFLVKLKTQSEKVQAADQKRSVEFKYFDPARMECSVSV